MPSLAARAVPPAIWEALHFSEQLQLSPEESNHSSLSYGLVALIPELHELERSVHNVQWTPPNPERAIATPERRAEEFVRQGMRCPTPVYKAGAGHWPRHHNSPCRDRQLYYNSTPTRLPRKPVSNRQARIT